MDKTLKRFDRESEHAITALIGSEIQCLLSDSASINAGSSLLHVMSVSIQLDTKRFFVLESDWADTPKEWLDYHCMVARLTAAPKGITYNPKPPKGGANYRFDHVRLDVKGSPAVVGITVLEASESGQRESVTYDAGLVIRCADGTEIAIVREESILGAMVIAHSPGDIARLTEGLRERTHYQA